METFNAYYNYVMPDHRLDSFPMMAQPWPMLTIVFLYFYGVYSFLPSYMADRKPYNLKTIITIYNIFQIIMSTVTFYGLATSGWTTHYSLIGCYDIGPPEDEMAMRMAGYLWCTWILRVVELSETVFFILRKKTSQVSFLHVYHHSTGVFLGWIGLKAYPGGMFSFAIMLNSSIHAVMYTYYLLSSFGPEMQKKLEIIKNKVTLLQLAQFVMAMLHCIQAFSPNCKLSIPPPAIYIGLWHVINLLLLFLYFYKKTYIKKNK